MLRKYYKESQILHIYYGFWTFLLQICKKQPETCDGFSSDDVRLGETTPPAISPDHIIALFVGSAIWGPKRRTLTCSTLRLVACKIVTFRSLITKISPLFGMFSV